MPPVINYETIGELGRLPAEILGLIFAQLSPIQQFKINVDPVLCAIFNQARDYNIPADIVNQEDLILYLLYALSTKRSVIDINKVPSWCKCQIELLISGNRILSSIQSLAYIIFNYGNICVMSLNREKILDLNDLDMLYIYICHILGGIDRPNKASLYNILINYACTNNEYLFVKHFVNKDASDSVYHQIIDSLSIYILVEVSLNIDNDNRRARLVPFVQVSSAYYQYIVKAWDVLNIHSDTSVIISIMERVFREPRLMQYRVGWVNEIMFKNKEFSIELFKAIRNSPLLSHRIKWVYVKIGDNVEIMYTNE